MKNEVAVWHLFNDSVVVHVHARTFTISKVDQRFKAVFDLIDGGRIEEMGVVADNRSVKELRALLDFLD